MAPKSRVDLSGWTLRRLEIETTTDKVVVTGADAVVDVVDSVVAVEAVIVDAEAGAVDAVVDVVDSKDLGATLDGKEGRLAPLLSRLERRSPSTRLRHSLPLFGRFDPTPQNYSRHTRNSLHRPLFKMYNSNVQLVPLD